MESISDLRQMMADQKFSEVQKQIELQFSINQEARFELLQLYFELHRIQQKTFPVHLAIELAEQEIKNQNFSAVNELIGKVKNKKYFSKIQKLKILSADAKGHVDQIHALITEFLLHRLEQQIPAIPEWLIQYIEKYFIDDFNLKLKLLAHAILVDNSKETELLIKDCISYCMESVSLKGKAEKLRSVSQVLKLRQGKDALDIYQSFCSLYLKGVSNKTEYKKLVEMVLYFDDFNFQVYLLELFQRSNLEEFTKNYVKIIRNHAKYDFVYLDKYFSHLKELFLATKPTTVDKVEAKEVIDLKLENKIRPVFLDDESEFEDSDEERKMILILKYQKFTTDQLCDIAVSFLQADLFKASLAASELAITEASDEKALLKASYLKYTAQLSLKDFRAALDTTLEALTHSSDSDDILSFLYAQAEVYIRLRQYQDARKILKKILSIDESYRMAKERLEKLNEI